MSPTGLCVWALGAQLVAIFWDILESLRVWLNKPTSYAGWAFQLIPTASFDRVYLWVFWPDKASAMDRAPKPPCLLHHGTLSPKESFLPVVLLSGNMPQWTENLLRHVQKYWLLSLLSALATKLLKVLWLIYFKWFIILLAFLRLCLCYTFVFISRLLFSH